MAYGRRRGTYQPMPRRSRKGRSSNSPRSQTRCLRVVAGAYRATRTEQVERETDTPPLDLYLNKRIAEFEARLEAFGMAQLIRDSNAAISNTLRQRTLNRRKNLPKFKEARSGTARAEWARRWVGDGATHEALQRDWQVRWEAIQRRRETATKTERGIHPPRGSRRPEIRERSLKTSQRATQTRKRPPRPDADGKDRASSIPFPMQSPWGDDAAMQLRLRSAREANTRRP